MRCCPSLSLSNHKPRGAPRRHVRFDLHILDAAGGRAVAQLVFEAIQRLTITFSRHFNRAVFAIRDPPLNPLDERGVLREPPIAHALHAPPYDKPPGLEHQHSIRDSPKPSA